MENKNIYKILSQEKLQCPYCRRVATLFNISRHLQGKSCQKYKQKYLNVNKDKTEDEYDLFIQNLKQNILHPELLEDE
jgi:hypothetical protein